MFMVTDVDQLKWAMEQDWIGLIIPFHRSGMPSKMIKAMGWTDFESQQNERPWVKKQLEAAGKTKRDHPDVKYIQQYDYTTKGGTLVPGHGGDLKKYLALCDQFQLNPKFYKNEFADGTKVIDHPGYMKLVTEFARSDTKHNPVNSEGIDFDAFEKIFKGWAQQEGYEREKKFDPGTVKSFMDFYAGKNREFSEFPPEAGIVGGAKEVVKKPEIVEKTTFKLAPKPDSPAFKKWFGKGHAVNKDGSPKLLAHATPNDFKAFRTARSDIGIHVGTPGQAEDRFLYKEAAKFFKDKKPTSWATMPVYVNIKNPLRTDDAGWWDWHNVPYALEKTGEFSKDEIGILEDFEQMAYEYEREFQDADGDINDNLYDSEGYLALQESFRDEVQSLIKKHGYDGIVYKNTGEIAGAQKLRKAAGEKGISKEEKARRKVVLESHEADAAEDSYIAFSSTQIKSTLNKGTFDPADPRVSHRLVPRNLVAPESSVSVETNKEVNAAATVDTTDPDYPTAANRDRTEELRKKIGIGQPYTHERKSDEDAMTEAKNLNLDDPKVVVEVAGEIFAQPDVRKFSHISPDVLIVGFNVTIAKMKEDHRILSEMIDKTEDPAEIAAISAELNRLEEDFDLVILAKDVYSTQTARALRQLGVGLAEDYTLIGVLRRAKAAAGKAVPVIKEKLFKQLDKRLQEANATIKRLQDKIASQKSVRVLKTGVKKASKMQPSARKAKVAELAAKLNDMVAKGCKN
jgi:hypothetical protein